MSVNKINKDEWKNFVDSFMRIHKNWYSDLKEIDDRGRERLIADNFRLKEIALDLELGENNNVVYIKGKHQDMEVNQIVVNVKNISVEKNNSADESIIFGSENGQIIQLEFKTTQSPDRLDGIVPDEK
jgi:hypothetical protein